MISLSVSDTTTGTTVESAAMLPAAAALIVMFVVPLETTVTVPSCATVATDGSDDVNRSDPEASTLSFADFLICVPRLS